LTSATWASWPKLDPGSTKSSPAKKNGATQIKLAIWRIIFGDNTYFFPAFLKTLPYGLRNNQPGRKERELKTLDL